MTTLSFLPQVFRTLRTRHAGDLSATWLLVFALGNATWLVYGVLRSDLPLTATNGVTFALVLTLIVAKYTIRAPRDSQRARQVGAPWRPPDQASEERLPDYRDRAVGDVVDGGDDLDRSRVDRGLDDRPPSGEIRGLGDRVGRDAPDEGPLVGG
jgi:MtN3 and saliva related transmembrane protein